MCVAVLSFVASITHYSSINFSLLSFEFFSSSVERIWWDELSAELLATGASSLAAAMEAAVAARLTSFIELQSVPRLTAAAALATWAGRYGEMWEHLYAKFVPSALPADKPRSEKRLLVIGPGFGQGSPDLLARQKMVHLRTAGFVLLSIFPSDPKRPDHDFAAGVAECVAALFSFKPHAVISGSRGGMYLMELWRLLGAAGGLLHGWNGASVMLNAHPSCVALPKRTPVIVVHSSGDTVFRRSRHDVESMVKVAGCSSACMYFTAGSAGSTGTATPAKVPDNHSEMQSLLVNDLLLRLVDAVIDVAPNSSALGINPEFNLHRSWRLLLSPARRAAEEALGLTPRAWVKRHPWASDGRGASNLFEVDAGSAEFAAVSAIFASDPTLPPYYRPAVVGTPWSQVPRVRSIFRVENRGHEGFAAQMEESIETALRHSGLSFTGGVHSRWLFHGAAPEVREAALLPTTYFVRFQVLDRIAHN